MSATPAATSETEETTGEGSEREESGFEIFGRVVSGCVGAIEEGTELLGATLREELFRFRHDVSRRMLAGALLLPGVGLVTSAVVILLHQWLGNLSAALGLVGAIYLAGAFYFLRDERHE